MKAPVSRCEAVCAHPVGRVATYTSSTVKRGVGRLVARRWQASYIAFENCGETGFFMAASGQIYHAVISKDTLGASQRSGQLRGPIRATQKARLRASRIKAGVTSDARQVTSARSADRFKGFRSFLPWPLSGISFGLKIDQWRLISKKTGRPSGLGRRLRKIGGNMSTENRDRLALRMGPDTKRKIDQWYEAAGCHSRN